jgi:hypothetical protein
VGCSQLGDTVKVKQRLKSKHVGHEHFTWLDCDLSTQSARKSPKSLRKKWVKSVSRTRLLARKCECGMWKQRVYCGSSDRSIEEQQHE